MSIFIDDSIELLKERFIQNTSGKAQLKNDGLRMTFRSEKSLEGKYKLTATLDLYNYDQKQWNGEASTIIGFFASLKATKAWLETEEGTERVNHCFNELIRISEKEPYEDWDW